MSYPIKMISDDEIEQVAFDWAEDFFGDAPTVDDSLDDYWIDTTSEFDADYKMTIPFNHYTDDWQYDGGEYQQVANWLEKHFPAMYRGDNGLAESYVVDWCNEFIVGQGYNNLLCTMIRFDRIPSSADDVTETVIFYRVPPQCSLL